MTKVEAAAEGSPELIEFRSWREVGSNRLLGLSKRQSEEVFEASLPLIMSLSEERGANWSERPDDVLRLTET